MQFLLRSHLLLLFFALGLTYQAEAQIVQALTFDSTSRSMMVPFPDGDHNQYEKILMYYTMRCKDGLVSTGSDRNRGCGEWDYSCNTYITDTSRVDSFKATAPSHRISGNFNGNSFEYSLNPTYSYYRSTLNQVTYTSTSNEVLYDVVLGAEAAEFPLGGSTKNRKALLLYQADVLSNAGLTAGDIDGLAFDMEMGTGTIPRLKLRLAQTSDNTIDGAAMSSASFTEVFYNDVQVDGSDTYLPFYSAFSWDGSSNIIVELSYTGADTDGIALTGATQGADVSLDITDENVGVRSEGRGNITIAENVNYTGDEVTFAFWYKGSLEQPLNSTVFEGIDSEGRRQANVHLPWSNSIVYWDCGNANNAYDRLSKAVNVESDVIKWNHWAFTKNVNTGVMQIYLNGESWAGSFSNRSAIDIQTLKILSSADDGIYSFGSLDDFYMLDKALSPEEIQTLMHSAMDSQHSLYDRLVLGFNFNDLEANSTALTDISSNNFTANITGALTPHRYLGYQFSQHAVVGDWLPNVTWYRGDYSMEVDEVEVLDSLQNLLYKIDEYGVVNNDLVITDTYERYLAGPQLIFNEFGDVVDYVVVPTDGRIDITTLNYFAKRNMKYELLSFVTPYGIGIDFGLEGKTWIFDVTDFGPILKGNKLLTMERGGQFQEEMDIKFEFIQGTPVRNVIDIAQVWPVTQEGYGRIIANDRFEPRTFDLNSDAKAFELHAAITGHGQEGEFIPRTHFLDVNDGTYRSSWQVWTECSDNPIYPQGGTWIYDRAGWCPGAPTDIETLVLEDATPGQEVTVDYGVTTATGDSRYIVNVQLVSYGDPNFQHDATMADIISPSSAAKDERFNPMCGAPIVVIKNTGSADLTAATINYGIEGQSSETFQWQGELAFGEEARVELPPMYLRTTADGGTFFAEIEAANDEYDKNDRMTSTVRPVTVHADNIRVNMFTNGAANETSWVLYDMDGNTIASSPSGLSAFTLYQEEINNLNGCYQLLITDTDGDGISWWANNDGNGYVSLTDIDGATNTIATDFGSIIRYEFVTDGFNPADEIDIANSVRVYPNPVTDIVYVDLAGEALTEDARLVDMAGKVHQIISKSDFSTGMNEIQIERHTPGVYALELVTKAGKQSFRVVIL